MIEWPDWYKSGAEPILSPVLWGSIGFLWRFHKAEGLYVVLPQYPKLRLVKND